MHARRAERVAEETRRRYDNVDELLADVFRVSAVGGRQSCAALAGFLARTLGYGTLTRMEIATEAINLRGAAIRAAGELGGAALVGVYEFPCDDRTRESEHRALDQVAQHCIRENHLLRDRLFVADGIRNLVGKRMHHGYGWWAERLGRQPSYIERTLVKDTRPTSRSVRATMRHLVVPALARVEHMLAERGIEWREGS